MVAKRSVRPTPSDRPKTQLPVDTPRPAADVYADGAVGLIASGRGMIKFDLYEDRLDFSAPNNMGRFITARVTMPRSAAAELAKWLAEQIAVATRPVRGEKPN
jgi:hypothetical protein